MSFLRYPKYKQIGAEWLGEVPVHWEVKRFQRCVQVAEGQVDPEDARYSSMPLIAPNHVEAGTGRLLALESAEEQGAESGKYLCNAGDVVYSKIRPALRKVCIAPEPCLCSADMYPLRAHSGLANPFLFWLILSEQFSSLAVLESQRVAMPKINRESLKEIELVVPPLAEQTAIAAFLDRETTKIDALVVEQQKLIELLREKRQAVISHSVTKGLNPNVPMKPSGIDWLGEVPAHWDVTSIKRFATLQRGYDLTDAERTEGNYPVVTSGGITGNHGSFMARGPGVVTGRYGSTGKLFFVEDDFWPHNTALYVSDFHGNQSRFVWYSLQTVDFAAHSAKAAVPGIDRNDIHVLPVAVPPLGEQRAIIDYLDNVTAKVDALITEAQCAVELLQERRTALISAAVTGKIDVRSAAHRSAA